LDIRYWFTRKSTVSISRVGTALIASGIITNGMIRVVIEALAGEYTIPGWIAVILLNALTILLSHLLSVKAIARAEFQWWKNTRWVPVVRIAPPSLREVKSDKLEARMGWGAKVTVSWFIHIIPSILD
jgi:hypothetical protein